MTTQYRNRLQSILHFEKQINQTNSIIYDSKKLKANDENEILIEDLK